MLTEKHTLTPQLIHTHTWCLRNVILQFIIHFILMVLIPVVCSANCAGVQKNFSFRRKPKLFWTILNVACSHTASHAHIAVMSFFIVLLWFSSPKQDGRLDGMLFQSFIDFFVIYISGRSTERYYYYCANSRVAARECFWYLLMS